VNEERRGEEARAVLENGIYKESYQAIRERILSQLEMADLPADKRGRLNDLLIALHMIHKYMENVLASGTMAAMEIERQRTLKERILRRA